MYSPTEGLRLNVCCSEMSTGADGSGNFGHDEDDKMFELLMSDFDTRQHALSSSSHTSQSPLFYLYQIEVMFQPRISLIGVDPLSLRFQAAVRPTAPNLLIVQK